MSRIQVNIKLVLLLLHQRLQFDYNYFNPHSYKMRKLQQQKNSSHYPGEGPGLLAAVLEKKLSYQKGFMKYEC